LLLDPNSLWCKPLKFDEGYSWSWGNGWRPKDALQHDTKFQAMIRHFRAW
jgi:hypothetical protein